MKSLKLGVTGPVGHQELAHIWNSSLWEDVDLWLCPALSQQDNPGLSHLLREGEKPPWPATYHRYFQVREALGSLGLPVAELLLGHLNGEEQECAWCGASGEGERSRGGEKTLHDAPSEQKSSVWQGSVKYLPTEKTVVSPGCILPLPSLDRPCRCSGCLFLLLQWMQGACVEPRCTVW